MLSSSNAVPDVPPEQPNDPGQPMVHGARHPVRTWAPFVIIGATAAAYANTFAVPFVFDDVASIVDNPTIRRLWPPGEVLTPPAGWGLTVGGRPLLNLSLAINYAISGLEVWSYHLVNLAIHLLAGLALYGLIRRTLELPGWKDRLAGKADMLALMIALIWALHPLQTESVTYVVQRAESLMGFWFLFSLYAFVRGVGSPGGRRWWVLSILACWLGVATKEVAALIPVLVLLYDRTFVSGSFGAAWRNHRAVHLALTLSWVPLSWLVLGAGGNRGNTMGFDIGVAWVGFWLTQFEAVVRYLGLIFWPAPLVFDYGNVVETTWREAWWWSLPVVALVVATLVALFRRPVAGFLGVWFFGILAPTSVMPSVVQATVEHRMYLPLAAVVAGLMALAALRLSPRSLGLVGAVLALAAGVATSARNSVYATEESLWRDTVAKRPDNARAHNNLGRVLQRDGRFDEAADHYAKAASLDPQNAQAHFNLGLVRFRQGDPEAAIPSFDRAVELLPHFGLAHLNRGLASRALGRPEQSLASLSESVKHPPVTPEAFFHLGVALSERGRDAEAVEYYRQAVAAHPAYLHALVNGGSALLRLTEVNEAAAWLERALALDPTSADIHFNLGLVETARGRTTVALERYQEAVRLDPTHASARLNFGIALGQSGDVAGALRELTEAARLRPDSPETLSNLGTALLEAGRSDDALAVYEATLRLAPSDPQAHYNAGYALLVSNRWIDARRHFEQALRIDPGFAPARMMLQNMGAR